MFHVEKGKIYFYKLPQKQPKPAKDWLDETLAKMGEVMLTEEEKKQIEKWNNQLMESWKEIKNNPP